MIIQSLTLENIRSYSFVNFEFNNGITFLSGDIGSGKSSVLQGIEFALFGFKRGDLDAQQLLRRGSSKGSVILSLRKGEEIIEICRNLKKTNSGINQENGYIKTGDTLAELSPSQINAHIFELLNFPKSFLNKDRHLIYRFCIYTPQEQLKEILYSNYDKRLEIIRKLFSIDKYKQLTNGIEFYTKELRENKISLKAKLENKQELEKEYETLVESLNTIENQQKEIEKKLEPLRKEVKELSKNRESILQNLDEYQQKRLKIEKSLEKLDSYKNRIDEIEEELKDLGKETHSISSIHDEKKELDKTILSKKEKIDELKKHYYSLEKKQESLHKYDLKKEELSSLEKQIEKYQLEHLESLQKELNELEHKKKELQNLPQREKELQEQKNTILEKKYYHSSKLEELQKQKNTILKNDECIMCKQNIPHTHKEKMNNWLEEEEHQIKKELENFEKQINDITENFEQIQKEQLKEREISQSITQKKEQLRQLESQKEEKNELMKKYETIKKELENFQMEDSKEQLKEEINQIHTSIESYQREVSKLLVQQEQLSNKEEKIKEQFKRKESLLEKKEKLEEQLHKKDEFIEKKQKVISYCEDLQQKQKYYQEELEKKQPELEKVQEQFTHYKTQNENLLNQKKQLEKKLEEHKKNEKELENIQKQEYFLNQEAIPISSKVESKLFTKFYLIATQEFQRIFKQLIEDQELEVRLNEEFSIIVEQNGHDIEVRQLSGGEKSSLAIAYKLALKKTIESFFPQEQYLDVLILDEPTDGFSAEQIQRLGILLKDLNVEQIVLVSHDEKIESIADRVIEIEKKNHESLRIEN